MDEVTRQQRRRDQREQTKLGRTLLSRGLVFEPKRDDMVAVARVVRAKLAEASNPRRSSEAAGLAHALAETSLKARPSRAAIACRKGCGYCCHSMVSVLAPEAFRIADGLRSHRRQGLEPADVAERARPLIGLGADERMGRKLPCPLLLDGACGIYLDRPIVCRQATSLDLGACIDEFEGRNPDAGIQVSSAHLAHTNNAHIALLAALKASDLPDAAYELAAALSIALADPGAEGKWLAGENVFASLPRAVNRPPAIEMATADIAHALRMH